ncbi:3-hydroxyacyl-CoA dehydrogenase family protein [Amycolatopsis acidicola]|uniref:3-hydroxyacyl-CoA dehydrogenase family protein n=1 Tax=Amycolatopsis acidicola TaxID=2596893 RepID=A0A5N0VCJ8_9PSEU|nr:3-hydroxyacyl-CoA dehydrogenase family protein [Amycolatopsis acidicola]KAA9163298.1 3-hydroxyacyl-CoA dehydrogenase family protein [Amycolatopsis acidicola]
MLEFERVAVLGFGTMGAGIAQVAAAGGAQVTVLEADQSRGDDGMRRLGEFLQGGVDRGKITADERVTILGRVRATTTLADLADARLVIEAVTERADVKKVLLAKVSEVVAPDSVIATNTSALSVSELATAVSHPERFAGLHFFNPAPLMKIIEIVRALQTAPAVLDRLKAFVQAVGKEPVVVKDRPGFLVNRLLMPYLNDVVQAFDDDLASAEDLDIALKLGLGYRQGPLELLDMIGLDVHEHATRSAYDATLDPAFAPPPLLRAMVAAGRLGTKNGKGFRTREAGK